MLKRFSEIRMKDLSICGGKGASLGEMMNAGLPIPNGFVLTTKAYGKDSKERENQVLEAFDKLNTKFVAVRSSGTKEDGVDDSFAGQFDTYLFVTRENLIKKIKECHDSVNSERIVSYCEYKGIDIKSIKVAVVVQKMVNSESAGVCFTVNPVSQNPDEIMIDAGYGVGEAVVSGMITPDNYIVNKKTGEIKKNISQQEKKLVLSDKGGTKEVEIAKEEQETQKLSDKHIQELAELAKKIEKHYGKPMDTEWAIENGELFMLQARPITTLGNISSKQSLDFDGSNFQPELRKNSQIYYNYQGLPFFTSIFEKCSSLEESRYSTPILYISKYTNDNKIISYLAGDFIGKGYNMINDLLNQKEDAKIFLARKNDLVIDCIKKCEKYISSKRTDFFNIRDDIQTAFADGRYVCNISYALQDYLNKLKESDNDLYKCLQSNILPCEETFLNKAEKYLIESINKNPNNYDIVYKKFMEKFYWFQNSYLGVKTISKEWLLNYYKELINKKDKKLIESKKPKLPKKYKLLIETASNAVNYQDNRKKLGLIVNEIMERWLKNLSKQTNISYDDLVWLTVDEIKSYNISIKKGIGDLKNKITSYKRLGKRFWILSENRYIDTDENLWSEVVELNTGNKNGINLKGAVGNKGKYVGKVKIVLNIDKDGKKLRKGDILVTGMTRPEFVPIMRKAGAFITDEGGVTCHAAIISRELGKPCIIGTKNATQVLKDGDLVEVDADNGIVKILSETEKDLAEDKQKIVKEFIERKKRYDENNPDAVFHFSYPGKVFYIHFPYYFYDDFKKEWGGDISVVFSYIINGKAHLFMSIYDGFVSKMIEKFEKKGLNRIRKKVEEIKHSLKKIENDKVLEGQELNYYCNKINTSFALLRDFCAFNQIAPSLDPYITKKLESFGVTKKDVMKYGVDEENGAMAIYKKNVNEFLQWAHKNNINLCEDYKILIKNKDFKNKLMGCYKNGYFFHSGYSGVKIRSPEKEFEKIRGTKISKDQQETFDGKRTKDQEKRLKISQYFSYHRDFRKEVQQKVFYYQARILEKIAKIVGISRDNLEYLQPDEYNTEFFSNIENVKKIIEKRKQGYMFIVTTKGKFFLDGSDANDIYAKIFQKDNTEEIAEIHGNTAYKGKYIGNVKIVFDTQKENKFNEGDILVTGMTTPEFVPIIKKSGAIITDAGGVTCHAAIISREFQKPCIVGTKIATQVLKDGDSVEVDADNGVVRVLERKNDEYDFKVKDGNKIFTPELRARPDHIHFSYQGVPFFSCIFSKCCTTEDTKRTTPANYVCEFKNLETVTQYVVGDFVGKGEDMINNMLQGKNDASIFLKKQDDIVRNCIKKCDKYIKGGKTDFLSIWNDIKIAFEAGCHVINLSYGLQKYLINLKEIDPKLHKIISENIVATKKSFVNQAGDYLKQLLSKYPNDFKKVYDKFMKKYGWFQNSYSGINHIDIKRLKKYSEDLLITPVNNEEKQKSKIEKKYNILIKTASDAIIYQDNKKKLGFMSMQIMENWLRDYAKKIKVSFKDLLWLTVEEILDNDVQTIKDKIKEYKHNGKRWGIMTERGYMDISQNFWLKVTELNKPKESIKSLNGITGCKGKYTGKVKIIANIEKDKDKFKKGDILVTGMTRPEFVAIMKKAGAFITDEGGVTCHAAIISRELGKPCIIGTKNATQVLKDGDLVEVDANNGVVTILKNSNGEKEIETEDSNDLAKKFNELKKYKHRDIQTFNAYPFFINSVATVSAFNLLPYNLHYTQILCEYDNDTVKWHYDIKDYEKLGKIFWGKCKNTTELLKLINKYDNDYKQSEEEFNKALSTYKKSKSDESRDRLLEKSVQFLASGAGSAHVLECASYYAEKNFTKGKIITPHDESFLSKAHKLAKKLKSKNDLKKAYKEFLKEYGRIKNTYMGRNTISIQEFSNLADEKDSKFMTPKYKKNSIEEMISYTFNRQDNRKKNIFKAIEKVDDALNLISKDIGINKKSLCFMLPNEISKINNKEFQEELKSRRIYFIDYTTKKEHYFTSQHIDNGENEEKLNDLKEIKGSIGNQGKIIGKARICQNLESIKNFNEGDILVTSMTRPEFITAMRKASAFVTDEGGITCHAAIISRELGKPCIIGTKIATKVLKDGDIIEVDADNGIIKIL